MSNNNVQYQDVVDSVYRALDEVNMMLPSVDRIEKSEAACLFGPQGALDSLGLINLIVAIEQEIESTYGKVLQLDGAIAGMEKNPFDTVASIASFIQLSMEQDDGKASA